MRTLPRLLLVPLLLALLPAWPAAARQQQAALSRSAARSLRQKVSLIVYHGEHRPGRSLSTVVTERELNSYLALDSSGDLPPGVTSPKVELKGDGRVSGSAVVDLDAVRASQKPGGAFDPMNLLTGKLPVAASGQLQARNGKARLLLESVSVAGVPVPRAILRELVAYYTRSPEFPRGVDIDDPFPLPSGIQSIQVRRGEAVVVQ